MISRLRSLRAPKVRSLNEITIYGQKIQENYALLQGLHPDDGIFPVVKSNAYGHGLKEVVQILRSVGCPYICVDSFPEYQIVRDFGNAKALIIGETIPENYRFYNQNDATICVYNIDTIRYLVAKKKKATIHLFLNTGMHREGLQLQDLGHVLALLKDASHITVEGLMSHFANADHHDTAFNQVQIESFKMMSRIVEKELGKIRWKHIGNSAGTALLHDDFFNGWRTGLALYGYSPFASDDKHGSVYAGLQPALTLSSTVTALQEIQTGDGVSYGLHWKTEVPTTVGTVPFGYNEGLDRRLRGKERPIHIADSFMPLVGTICMNLSCFHCGDTKVSLGDHAILIDASSDAPNTIYALADTLGTIPYEVLVKLSPTIRRSVV